MIQMQVELLQQTLQLSMSFWQGMLGQQASIMRAVVPVPISTKGGACVPFRLR